MAEAPKQKMEMTATHAACNHDWWVYSTAEGMVLVECKRCPQRGTVLGKYPRWLWEMAFHAPSRPFRLPPGFHVSEASQ